MPEGHEPLVSEERLERAWETILARYPGALDLAVPDAYIQPSGVYEVEGKPTHLPAVAVFTVAEPNPRYPGTLQVSVAHQTMEGWEEMQREVAESTLANKVDPVTWILAQVAKGHLKIMQSIRDMLTPVTHVDPFGEQQPGALDPRMLEIHD